MIKVLGDFGIKSGNLLDLCCGNGRISIPMAKKGFKTVGVDFSKPFIADARKKAKQHKVSGKATFLEGDVRKLKQVIGKTSKPFDVVVNAWTSIGYSSQKDDLTMFKQARELSRDGAILFIIETGHTEFFSLRFTPTGYQEVGDVLLMENRKYDPITAQMHNSWAFYRKHEEDLKFIDRVEIKHHIYSLSELASLLKKAGWETVAYYGSLATLQPMTSLSSLNLVAKAQ